jgi:molybdate transport system permease protein
LIDLQPLTLSLELAAVTTAILFTVGIPLSFWLSRTTSWIRIPIQALVIMPLVLPPTVLGFYLLLGLSPTSCIGHIFLQYLHLRLVFSFTGIAIGTIISSLPFMVICILAGFQSLPGSLAEASRVLGKTEFQTLFHVLLPNIKPALFTGVALTFAQTMGEFGVVLMIGGKIPGITRTASTALYDEVEAMNYTAAHLYAGILFTVSFGFLLLLLLINRRLFRGNR